MTTDEIEYQVDLGHVSVSSGTYFLEMSGNVSPVYAWAWEIDRRADASALALRNQHGVWTDQSIVARYGVLTGGEISWGYPPEQVTTLYRIVSDQPPHSSFRLRPQFSRLWQPLSSFRHYAWAASSSRRENPRQMVVREERGTRRDPRDSEWCRVKGAPKLSRARRQMRSERPASSGDRPVLRASILACTAA